VTTQDGEGSALTLITSPAEKKKKKKRKRSAIGRRGTEASGRTGGYPRASILKISARKPEEKPEKEIGKKTDGLKWVG